MLSSGAHLFLYKLCCFSFLLAVTSVRSELLVKHSWVNIPHDWEFHDIPSRNHPVILKIGLKQGNIDRLLDTLYEISNPFSDRYGSYLSRL